MKELILLLKQYKKEIDEYNDNIPKFGKTKATWYTDGKPEKVDAYYRMEPLKEITADGFLEWLAEGKGDTE